MQPVFVRTAQFKYSLSYQHFKRWLATCAIIQDLVEHLYVLPKMQDKDHMRIIDISLPFLLFFFLLLSRHSNDINYNDFLDEWLLQLQCCFISPTLVRIHERNTSLAKLWPLSLVLLENSWQSKVPLFYYYFNIQKYFLLKHRKKLAVTLSLQMQNSCKPTFRPEGAKNIYPGLLLSSLLFLCLQRDSLPLTYTQTFWEQRVAEPLHLRAVFSLLWVQAFGKSTVGAVWASWCCTFVYTNISCVYPQWNADIAHQFQLCLTHSRQWHLFQQCQHLANCSLY